MVLEKCAQGNGLAPTGRWKKAQENALRLLRRPVRCPGHTFPIPQQRFLPATTGVQQFKQLSIIDVLQMFFFGICLVLCWYFVNTTDRVMFVLVHFVDTPNIEFSLFSNSPAVGGCVLVLVWYFVWVQKHVATNRFEMRNFTYRLGYLIWGSG